MNILKAPLSVPLTQRIQTWCSGFLYGELPSLTEASHKHHTNVLGFLSIWRSVFPVRRNDRVGNPVTNHWAYITIQVLHCFGVRELAFHRPQVDIQQVIDSPTVGGFLLFNLGGLRPN
jgi:hypothetical protein